MCSNRPNSVLCDVDVVVPDSFSRFRIPFFRLFSPCLSLALFLPITLSLSLFRSSFFLYFDSMSYSCRSRRITMDLSCSVRLHSVCLFSSLCQRIFFQTHITCRSVAFFLFKNSSLFYSFSLSFSPISKQ